MKKFPLFGAVFVSLYFIYQILLGGGQILLIELLLLPIALPLWILSLLSSFPISTFVLKIVIVICIPLLGYVLFQTYQGLFKRLKKSRTIIGKVGNVTGFIIISLVLWGFTGLLMSTHNISPAINIFTGECKSFGGEIGIGYRYDISCSSLNGTDPNLLGVPLDPVVESL